MSINIQTEINRLAQYCLDHHLVSRSEKYYSVNMLLDVLNLDEFEEMTIEDHDLNLEKILSNILDWAAQQGLLTDNTTVYRDLFDTKVMNCFLPRPDTVTSTFNRLYQVSPKAATDWYYQFSQDSDYIRSYRVRKDLCWKTETPYGDIDITINLSKPEKDPKAIAAAKSMKQTAYPKCQLCAENMGYRGRVNHPARENLRIIPIHLGEDAFYLQYSPYSYFKEHCIVFNKEHVPMVVNESCLRHLVSFVSLFPTYMLGSNADLPIVGGSILTHDHYQGGGYRFPMFDAKDAFTFRFKGFEDVEASYLHWPLSVIRIKSRDSERLIQLAVRILDRWRRYDDAENNILHETEGVPHNTITPICHFEKGMFVLDLTLRNNITTEQYPLGVYHPHPEYWNIKKENIGLIEVMGRAILPSRLKAEMAAVSQAILDGRDFSMDPTIGKHWEWFSRFRDGYAFTQENVNGILEQEIGKTFCAVLECAGVYKQDEQGKEAVRRFIAYADKEN